MPKRDDSVFETSLPDGGNLFVVDSPEELFVFVEEATHEGEVLPLNVECVYSYIKPTSPEAL